MAVTVSIERKAGVGGTYAEVASGIAFATGTWTDTPEDLVAGVTYYYRARSYETEYSDYSNEVSETYTISVCVERKTGVGGTYAQIAAVDITDTSYLDTQEDLVAETVYHYRTRKLADGTYSAYSAEASIVYFVPVITASGAGINVPGVFTGTRISIERKAGVGGTYAEVTVINAATGTWTDTNEDLVDGVTYYYRARSTEDEVSYSDYSNEVSVGYVFQVCVERKTGVGGTYAQIAAVDAADGSYLDTQEDLVSGNTYYYRTRYLGGTDYSSYSVEDSILYSVAGAATLTAVPMTASVAKVIVPAVTATTLGVTQVSAVSMTASVAQVKVPVVTGDTIPGATSAQQIAFRGWVPDSSAKSIAFLGWVLGAEAGPASAIVSAATLTASAARVGVPSVSVLSGGEVIVYAVTITASVAKVIAPTLTIAYPSRTVLAPVLLARNARMCTVSFGAVGPNLMFNGTDLSMLGFAISSFDRSSPGKEQFTADISTREYVDRWDRRYVSSDLSVSGVVSSDDRAAFLSALESLSNAVSPDLGWCNLKVFDVDHRHMVAKGNGIRIQEEWPMFKKPFMGVELSFLRRDAFWYSDETVTGTIPATVTNAGTVKAYPVWTITVGSGGEPSGFALRVGTQIFQYVSALSAGDVVTVDTDPSIKSVEVNGYPTVPGAVYEFVDFPYLDVGTNVCTKNGNVTIGYSYYSRYLVGA